jgi:hypothetical protein
LVVIRVNPSGVSTVLKLPAVNVAPAPLLREKVSDFMLAERWDCLRDAADIPGGLGRQG